MSTHLDVSILHDKFNQLNSSQQSIETTSSWIQFFRRDSKKVVTVWETEFVKAPWNKRLAMLYLANDILQNSRKRGSEFVQEFHKTLPKAVEKVLREGDDKTKRATHRLISIWDDRKVFGGNGIKAFKEVVERCSSQRSGVTGSAPSKVAADGRPSQHPKWNLVEQVADILFEVQQATSNRTELMQKRDQLPEGWQASNSINDLTSAIDLLDQCARSLAGEIGQRTRAEAVLRGLCESQSRALRQGEGLQRQCQQQLEAVRGKVAVLQQQQQQQASIVHPYHGQGAIHTLPSHMGPAHGMSSMPAHMGPGPAMMHGMHPYHRPASGMVQSAVPHVVPQTVPQAMTQPVAPPIHMQQAPPTLPTHVPQQLSGLKEEAVSNVGPAMSNAFPPHQAAQLLDVNPTFDDLYEPGADSESDMKDEMDDAFDTDDASAPAHDTPLASDPSLAHMHHDSPIAPEGSPVGPEHSPLASEGSPTKAGSGLTLKVEPPTVNLTPDLSAILSNGHLLQALASVTEQPVSAAPEPVIKSEPATEPEPESVYPPVAVSLPIPAPAPVAASEPAGPVSGPPSESDLSSAAALLASQLTEAESAKALLEALAALPQNPGEGNGAGGPGLSQSLDGLLGDQGAVSDSTQQAVEEEDDVYNPEDADFGL